MGKTKPGKKRKNAAPPAEGANTAAPPADEQRSSSRRSSVSSHASSQDSNVAPPKNTYKISEEHELLLLDWMRDQHCLWDQKDKDYKNRPLRAALWEKKAKEFELDVEYLQKAYRDLRDMHCKIHRETKSGQAPKRLTAREEVLVARFKFLESTFRHKAAPVQSVDEAVDGDLHAAETRAADSERLTCVDNYAPKKKKTAHENGKMQQEILTQLSERDHHMEAIASRLATVQAEAQEKARVGAENDPNDHKKKFCDWVKSEIMLTSPEEFRDYQNTYFSLRESWRKEKERAEQQHQYQQQQQQVYMAPPSTSSSPAFQPLPGQWATTPNMPATSVWGSQTQAYNRMYVTRHPSTVQQPIPSLPDGSTHTLPGTSYKYASVQAISALEEPAPGLPDEPRAPTPAASDVSFGSLFCDTPK